MQTTLPHLTGGAASHYIEHITVLEVVLDFMDWLEMESKYDVRILVESDDEGRVCLDLFYPSVFGSARVVSYWSVEEARRIVDAINAAIAYVESSKGGA